MNDHGLGNSIADEALAAPALLARGLFPLAVSSSRFVVLSAA
jgi:hypothetical protein